MHQGARDRDGVEKYQGVKIKGCIRANSGFTAKCTLEKDFLESLHLTSGWHEPGFNQGFE